MFLPTDITLKSGDSGDYVRELQLRLVQRSLLGDANITSFYDGPTTQAVMEFQNLNGLRSDGIAGPETLRRLVSIGAGEEGEASSGNSEEEEQAQSFRKERHDDLALAAAEDEQQKLANEAVWGQDATQTAATEEAHDASQEQLSELDRYQQSAEAKQAAEQQAAQERLDYARSAEYEQQQPAPDAQSASNVAENQTVAEPPPAEPAASADATAADRRAEQAASVDMAAQQPAQPDQPVHKAADPAPDTAGQPVNTPDAGQAQTATAPAAPDPILVRMDNQLDAPSRQESRMEGQRLDANGVANNGTVPLEELGELSPDRSPAIRREQEVARV